MIHTSVAIPLLTDAAATEFVVKVSASLIVKCRTTALLVSSLTHLTRNAYIIQFKLKSNLKEIQLKMIKAISN